MNFLIIWGFFDFKIKKFYYCTLMVGNFMTDGIYNRACTVIFAQAPGCRIPP